MEKLRLHPPDDSLGCEDRSFQLHVFLHNNTLPLGNLTLPERIIIVLIPSQVGDDALATVVVLMSDIAVPLIVFQLL